MAHGRRRPLALGLGLATSPHCELGRGDRGEEGRMAGWQEAEPKNKNDCENHGILWAVA